MAKDCWENERNTRKRLQWCKKGARNVKTGTVTTDEMQEIVLTGDKKKENEHYDDSSDESECYVPKLLARSGGNSSMDSVEWNDKSYEENIELKRKRSRWKTNHQCH